VSDVRALRDDGPLARAVFGRYAAATQPGPFVWLGLPLVRGVEYGGVIALVAASESSALPACFAYLAVLAFHHYDLLAGVRTGRDAPAPRVAAAGGGWELRLAAVGILAATGTLGPGLVGGAIGLGLVYVGEAAVRQWRVVSEPDDDATRSSGTLG